MPDEVGQLEPGRRHQRMARGRQHHERIFEQGHHAHRRRHLSGIMHVARDRHISFARLQPLE